MIKTANFVLSACLFDFSSLERLILSCVVVSKELNNHTIIIGCLDTCCESDYMT